MFTPVNPTFTIQKWGSRGSKLYRRVFVMETSQLYTTYVWLRWILNIYFSILNLLVAMVANQIKGLSQKHVFCRKLAKNHFSKSLSRQMVFCCFSVVNSLRLCIAIATKINSRFSFFVGLGWLSFFIVAFPEYLPHCFPIPQAIDNVDEIWSKQAQGHQSRVRLKVLTTTDNRPCLYYT